MANCTICNEPIILTPSAAERARKYGGKPSDYTALFNTHSHCFLSRRFAQAKENMRRARERSAHG